MVDLSLPDGGVYTVDDHETVRRRFTEALDQRKYVHVSPPVSMVNSPTGPATEPSRLGATLEATDAGVLPVARSPYRTLHNTGHNMISGASTDELGNRREGVMFDQGTAIRDTSFWEWHKHIDNFCADWQQCEDPHTFADRPPVRLRKRVDPADGAVSSPDLLLVFEDQLPEEARHNPDHLQEWPNLRAWAQATFGGDRWDEDGSAAGLTTAMLETSMLQRPLTLSDRVTTVPLGHLTHRPFVYVLRLENTADRRVQLTVRIFLVPSSRVEERRAWIEMDKFVQALEPLEKAAVARRGAQSSVIRKPANMTPQLFKAATILLTQDGLAAMVAAMVAEGLPGTVAALLQPFVGRVALLRTVQRELGREQLQVVAPFLQRHATIRPGEQPQAPTGGTAEQIEAAEAANYCTCGWPYNLLLPRGTPEGMPFRLAVVCTDWEIDRTPTEEAHPCGSVSFCGALDVYPDVRPMGYPFDRRFVGSISDAIMANDNMAARDLRIRQLPDRTVDD